MYWDHFSKENTVTLNPQPPDLHVLNNNNLLSRIVLFGFIQGCNGNWSSGGSHKDIMSKMVVLGVVNRHFLIDFFIRYCKCMKAFKKALLKKSI